MILRVILSQPVGGYWDGGQKQTFDFRLDPPVFSDGRVRVGSWEMNAWKEVAHDPKSERRTLSRVMPGLKKYARRIGVGISFEYIN